MKRTKENKLTNYFTKISKTEKNGVNVDEIETIPVPSESACDSSVPLEVFTEHDSAGDKGETGNAIKDYPSVWSEEQWLEREAKHKWLVSKNGRLGCSDCASVRNLGLHKTQGLFLSNEWVCCEVSFNGKDKAQQLKSLRTKISAHQASQAHNKASEILAESRKTKLENSVLLQQTYLFSTTEKIFNTAYYLIKNDRPFSDFEDLIQLQKRNGLDLGLTLHSRYSATEIVKHVASEFRKKLMSKLIAENQKLSVLIDESTTLGKESVLIVYIKTFINGKEELIFLDLIALSNQKAETIVTELLNCLHSYGLSEAYLEKHLICLTCDGASVMVGKVSGVGKLLKDRLQQPNIIIWHCLNHRLELAVHDCIADMNAINHFKSFVDTLYALFNQSPKITNELKAVASDLSIQLTKIGKVLDTRWVSSSFRSVSAVWSSYLALVTYFKEAANDSNRPANERNKFNGLYLRMESVEFLQDLALMYDVLEELSSLSLQLQERNVTVTQADKLIKRTVRIIETYKEKPGLKEREVNQAVVKMTYDGLPLTHNKRIVSIDRLQFITSVVNNLRARCFATVAVHRKKNDENENELYNQMLKDFETLNPDVWPEHGEKDLRFGEESIIKMCSLFRLPNDRSVLNGFRQYFDEGGKKIPVTLAPLSNAIRTIPCSTAECERGFSAMNVIITKLRTRLLISNVSSALFIKLNGPPLFTWNALQYVKSWLLRHRSAEDTRSRHVGEVEHDNEKELWKLF